MRVYYADHYEVPLPTGHRFPMEKYALLRAALIERGILRIGGRSGGAGGPADGDALCPAEPAPLAAVALAHSRPYLDGVLHGTLSDKLVRGLGFPWSPELVTRSLASVGGTIAAARAALSSGIAGNLAGGTHHAFADRGEGFCVFNDLAITTLLLLREEKVRRVLIMDLDVHQGNGTAAILRGQPGAFTCSLHGERNYPFRKEQSDLDIGLPDGCNDDQYLAALQPALHEALARSAPELILYQAGVDPLKGDRLGRLALSHAGLRQRDRMVLAAARARGVPIALTLGGGYASPITATVEAYVGTYAVAKELYG